MKIRYPGVHHGIGDDEDEHHRLVPGQWRQDVNLQDMEEVTAGNRVTQMVKKQIIPYTLLQFTCWCNSMAK